MSEPILTFNAKSVPVEKLEKTLLGRKQILNEIYAILVEKLKNGESFQSLVVGPRGSGKTHMTKVIFERLRKEPFKDQFVLLSLNRNPVKGKKIAQLTFLSPNVVSKQLSELNRLGYIDKHSSGKDVYYEIKEPLMRICFEINENPHGAAKLFVDFLKVIYSKTQLKQQYLRFKYGREYDGIKVDSRFLREAEMYRNALDSEELKQLTTLKAVLINTSLDEREKIISVIDQFEVDWELIDQYRENKEYSKIIELISPIADVIPSAGIYRLLADCYYYIKDYTNSIELLEKMIHINPRDAVAYNNLGIALSEIGAIQSAFEKHKKAIQIDPEFVPAYVNLGIILTDNNDYDGAIKQFNKAIQINPEDINAYIHLGYVLSQIGEIKGSIEQYKKVIQINPEDAAAYTNLGNQLSQIGDFEGALNHFKKAIQLDPEHANVYFNLGFTLSQTKDFEGAILQYKKAIQLDSGLTEAYYNLGNIFAKDLHDFEGAIDQFKKAIENNPEYVNAYNNLGYVLLKINKIEDAIKYLKKSDELSPQQTITISNLLHAYVALGVLKEFKACLKKIKESDEEDSRLVLENGALNSILTMIPPEKLETYFIALVDELKQMNKIQLLFNVMSTWLIEILIKIEEFDQTVLKNLSDILEKIFGEYKEMQIPIHFYRCGYAYIIEKDKDALLSMSKEERKLFEDQVLKSRVENNAQKKDGH